MTGSLRAIVLRLMIFAVPLLWPYAPAAVTAGTADSLTLQLKWLPQAQFAGYLVARAKGMYTAAGLSVTIKPGSDTINPSEVLAHGGADVAVDSMPSALAAREHGAPVVNIAQVFQRSGLELTCRRDSGIRSPDDFRGKTIGVWFGGDHYPFLAWMSKLNLATNGGPNGVTVMHQGFSVDPLVKRQASCISTMSYNEYWQLVDAGMAIDQLIVFKYEDEGVAMLEDGLYTTEAKLKDPASAARLARFVKASMQGWVYAITHRDEAVKIVVAAGGVNPAHQKRMLAAVGALIDAGDHDLGYLDEAAAQRTVKVLLVGSSDPVITRPPQGAWTHAVWNRAFGH